MKRRFYLLWKLINHKCKWCPTVACLPATYLESALANWVPPFVQLLPKHGAPLCCKVKQDSVLNVSDDLIKIFCGNEIILQIDTDISTISHSFILHQLTVYQ